MSSYIKRIYYEVDIAGHTMHFSELEIDATRNGINSIAVTINDSPEGQGSWGPVAYGELITYNLIDWEWSFGEEDFNEWYNGKNGKPFSICVTDFLKNEPHPEMPSN